MKKWLILLASMMLLLGAVGCSDDDDGPTGGGDPIDPTVPTLASIGNVSVNFDNTLNLSVSATMTDTTKKAILTTSTLPTGATFTDNNDGSGTLNWAVTFDNVGEYDVTFYATNPDSATLVDSEAITITVTAVTGASEYLYNDGYWNSNINATSSDNFVYFSFTTKDIVTNPVAKPYDGFAASWDMAFRREEIKTNGGSSTINGGDIEAASLGVVNFDAVTMDDTVDVDWNPDVIEHFIDEWYIYNDQTHEIIITEKVYSMLDATGEHYVKFRIDSLIGGGQPPAMGDIYMTYYYQPIAGSLDLSGQTVETSFTAGSTPVYFDFSTGAVTTPADPANSLDWDIYFYNYDLYQNSGPSGIGDCAAFLAWSELADSSNIDGFTAQPGGAPLFPDIAGSALTDWYNYTGPPLHQLPSKSEVYLLKTEGKVYKLRIESYYGEDGGSASGNYNFIWKEL